MEFGQCHGMIFRRRIMFSVAFDLLESSEKILTDELVLDWVDLFITRFSILEHCLNRVNVLNGSAFSNSLRLFAPVRARFSSLVLC